MKLKYYTELGLKLILFSVIFTLILVQISSAALLTSSASPTSIFKCQPSSIAAIFNDAGIIGVNALVSSKTAVQPMVVGSGNNMPTTQTTVVALVFNGTHWVGIFGNDETLLWGTRTVSYQVDTGVITTYTSGTEIFVYGDRCTGTGATNYTQIGTTSMGKFTKMLYQGQFDFLGTSLETSFIGFAIFPWIEVWGYLFYLLVVFTVVTTIYLKTQNVTQPIAVGVFLLLIFASSAVIDAVYRQWVIFFLALGITALYYRIFVRD